MEYSLLFAGGPFNPQLRGFLTNISIKDEIGLLSDTVDMTFTYDERLPDFELGMIVTVKLGDAQKLWDVGQYNISEINLQGPPHELVVRGLSSPFLLKKGLQDSHIRGWQRGEAKLSEIMEIVVSEAGFTLEYNAPDEIMPHTWQKGETDAEFLARLGRLRDLRFKVSDDKIVVFKTDASVNLSGVPLKTLKINYVGDQIKYTYRRSERDAYQSAVAWVQDIQSGEKAMVQVPESGGNPQFVFTETFSTEAEAEAACQTKLSESNRYTRVATIEMPPRPDVIAGGTMIFSGFPREMNDKKFLIETVNHDFSSTGGYVISTSLVNTDE